MLQQVVAVLHVTTGGSYVLTTHLITGTQLISVTGIFFIIWTDGRLSYHLLHALIKML